MRGRKRKRSRTRGVQSAAITSMSIRTRPHPNEVDAAASGLGHAVAEQARGTHELLGAKVQLALRGRTEWHAARSHKNQQSKSRTGTSSSTSLMCAVMCDQLPSRTLCRASTLWTKLGWRQIGRHATKNNKVRPEVHQEVRVARAYVGHAAENARMEAFGEHR